MGHTHTRTHNPPPAVSPHPQADVQRFFVAVLPRAVVHHALPDRTRGGLLGRPACASPVPGVWYAGDWVGPEGHLADAAAASALSVARGIAAEGEGRLRFAS